MIRQTCLIGYPPADNNVRNYFTEARSSQSAVVLIQNSLLALFNETDS